MKFLRWLLIFVPLAFVAEFALADQPWGWQAIFLTSAVGLVPLAGFLGEATEELAAHTGPKLGGFLNASLGNAAELIITIVALRAGEHELVKASITGSILGNLLVILGLSLLLGGLKNGLQRFDRDLAGLSSTMMSLAVIGLIVPTLFYGLHGHQVDLPLEYLSWGVAGILLLLYVLSVVFTFVSPLLDDEAGTAALGGERAAHVHPWPLWVAVTVLVGATLATVFLSEFLVGAVEPVVETWGLSRLFIGLIIVPFVGNVAEHLVAVQVAVKNKMQLSLIVSLSSSMQVALFVAPVVVFVSLLMGGPMGAMDLHFYPFEVICLGLSVVLATFISMDGESHWLEGAALLSVYLIVVLAVFFL
ncbi:MAG: calcium/proton exchanger [Chloroflexia bacterium]